MLGRAGDRLVEVVDHVLDGVLGGVLNGALNGVLGGLERVHGRNSAID